MDYMIQPRGPGTAWMFRIRTPSVLIGQINPDTGKPFRDYIKRSLGGERHLPTARKMRDIRLAEVRTMEAEFSKGDAFSRRFSLERAEEWAESLRDQEANGGPDQHEPDIRSMLYDEILDAPDLPKNQRPTKAKLKAFEKTALRNDLSFQDATDRYLRDRRPGNGFNYAPIKPGTERDVWVAVHYVCRFLDAESPKEAFLGDIEKDDVRRFRGEFLPGQKSPRAPEGLSIQTIEKYTGLLRTLWTWAIQHGYLPSDFNPWTIEVGVRRQKRGKGPKRDMYSAQEVSAVLAAFPQGDRLGDIFRLALVSGCRANEIAKVYLNSVAADFSSFAIPEGKSENAKRVIPVPKLARKLLERRVQFADEHIGNVDRRLFPDFPLRPSTGKASSVSQMFTRKRRKLLGKETNGRLNFHSLRHTWFTIARRAGVPAGDANDLGGWAGERTSSSSYDHKLLLKDLSERQETVAKRLEADGYLEKF